MIPAIVGGIGLGLGAVHSVGQLMDNRRYWNDYYKNTGVSNRYYWKSGVGDWAKFGSRSLMAMYGFRGLGPREFYIYNNHYHHDRYFDYSNHYKYSDVIRFQNW